MEYFKTLHVKYRPPDKQESKSSRVQHRRKLQCRMDIFNKAKLELTSPSVVFKEASNVAMLADVGQVTPSLIRFVTGRINDQ